MNVAAQERLKTSARIRKNFSGSGHRRLREGDSGSLEGRIWRDAVGAKDSRSANPNKRTGRAKLVGGEEWPQRFQPSDPYAPLGSRSENSTGTGKSPRPRLGVLPEG